jgi:hypothetical protein
MGALGVNSSIRGADVSCHHIQNFREVVYNENSRRLEARRPESDTI